MPSLPRPSHFLDALLRGVVALVGAAMLLGEYGGCLTPSPTHDPVYPSEMNTPEGIAAACERAAERLHALHCKQDRPGFAAFCQDVADAGVPIRAVCLSEIGSCDDVDACRRKPQ